MLHLHAAGTLITDPLSRTSAKGTTYTTGVIKCIGKDGDAVVSFICFSESSQQELLNLKKGDSLSIAGPGKLSQWTGKDGEQKHGLSVVADRILSHSKSTEQAATARARSRRWPLQFQQKTPKKEPALTFDDEIPF